METKMRALIVEDEQASRETLRNYVNRYCPELEVVGEAADVQKGVEAVRQLKPDLVFLDVEMPFGNAFDLLEQVGDIDFETIFVTAYSHYAMKALNFSAAYYLLKPIDIDELVLAVGRAKESFEKDQIGVKTRILVENLKAKELQQQKILLPILEGFEIVRLNEIVRCEADGNFTKFHMVDGQSKLICRTLKHFTEMLEEGGFMRVHRSHLVNLEFVAGYRKGKGGQLSFRDGSVVEVSPRKKEELLNRL